MCLEDAGSAVMFGDPTRHRTEPQRVDSSWGKTGRWKSMWGGPWADTVGLEGSALCMLKSTRNWCEERVRSSNWILLMVGRSKKVGSHGNREAEPGSFFWREFKRTRISAEISQRQNIPKSDSKLFRSQSLFLFKIMLKGFFKPSKGTKVLRV